MTPDQVYVQLEVADMDKKHTSRKPTSFLSRLSMIGGNKKRIDDDLKDSDSQVSEHRVDGVDAQVFSFSGAAGYIPHHKEPPRYIRIKAHYKKNREFNRTFLAQELIGTLPPSDVPKKSNGIESNVPITTAPLRRSGPKTGGAIWSMVFSKDGRYLAAAGKDKVVRVWAVISTHEERRAHEEEEMVSRGKEGEKLSAPVFRNRPVREFIGHSGEVLDLSWSKNNFLLSSSMDKTVKLWHMTRKECLCSFTHPDFVTSIAFHPKDDRFFLAGSLDSILRLWSIPDKAVAYSARLHDLITAVAFSPDGKTSIAGVLNGFCYFYDTEGLKTQTSIHVRSSRGKNAKGSKITGIATITVPARKTSPASSETIPEEAPSIAQKVDGVKVLVTSNDSRIRVYNLKDKSLEAKFKGHENACSQISASFSDDAQYVICGSEDRRTYVWNMASSESGNDSNKRPAESFEAHSDIVTAAVFAPIKTRQLLGSSGDPIYDLCNPPPVMLMSREEEASVSEDHGGSDIVLPNIKKPEESPTYIARSTHYNGNILVTADHTGIIKVFRQDCAWAKRRHESWDTGSLPRRLGPGVTSSRPGSIATRTSGSHSQHDSLSTAFNCATSAPQQACPNDRILNWRAGLGESGSTTGTPTTIRNERSLSPSKKNGKLLNSNYPSIAHLRRKELYTTNPSSPVTRLNADVRKGWDKNSSELSLPQSPTGSVVSVQNGLPPPTKLVGILKKRESVDPAALAAAGAALVAGPNPSLTPLALEAHNKEQREKEERKKDEIAVAFEPSDAAPLSSPTSFGMSSLWGKWKGISSFASLRGAAAFGPTSFITGPFQTVNGTSNGDRSGPVDAAAAMDPANYDSGDEKHELPDSNHRKSIVKDDRRKSMAEPAIGNGELVKFQTKARPRHKSVGFVNVKPSRESEEEERGPETITAREYDVFKPINGSALDVPTTPTRRSSNGTARRPDNRASHRHSLPPPVLRKNLFDSPSSISSSTRNYQSSHFNQQQYVSDSQRSTPFDSADATAVVGKIHRHSMSQMSMLIRNSDVSTLSGSQTSGEEMRCNSCGGKEFNVKNVVRGGTQKQRFLCGRCGTLAIES